MNKHVLVVVLSLLTVWGVNYMTQKSSGPVNFGGEVAVEQKEAQLGEPIIVPTKQELHAPLNFMIERVESETFESYDDTSVATDQAKLHFSGQGASIAHLQFNEHHGKGGLPLATVEYEPKDNRKDINQKIAPNTMFFLGLEKGLLWNYRLVEQYADNQSTKIIYETDHVGWRVRKTFVVYKATYKIDVTLSFEKRDEQAESLKPRLLLAAPQIAQLEADSASLLVLNERSGSIDKKNTQEAGDVHQLAWHWRTPGVIFGLENKYFVHTLFNDPQRFVQRGYVLDQTEQTMQTPVSVVLEGPRIDKSASWTMSYYCGPKTVKDLGAVDARLEELLSFGWLSWLCKLLLRILQMIFGYVHNYGVAIILLSILLKLPFMPLSIYARIITERYQRYQPTINKIRSKYKNNLQLQQQELMRFHKDHNLSPATPLLGCLPLLIQMPIMFALYKVLSGHIDLYQAPFFGWITDLSAKDPYYIIPILMGIAMFWQQMKAPILDEKQRFVMAIMPIVMTGLFAGFPAGLVLYWFMNGNILVIGEDYIRKIFFKR